MFFCCLFLNNETSFLVWDHRGGDVSGPQLQHHLIPQHMDVHLWPEGGCHTSKTIQGNISLQNVALTLPLPWSSGFNLLYGQVLMEMTCFEPLRKLACGMFLPQCSPQGGVLQPCRSVCSSAKQQCSRALDLLSFSWPFNCHLLPDSEDPVECSQP